MDDTTNTIINIAGGCVLGGIGAYVGSMGAALVTAAEIAVVSTPVGAVLGAMTLIGIALSAKEDN